MEFLKKLMETFGPTGAEEEVREIIKKEIKPYVDEVMIDKFGNLIAHKTGDPPKVMLAAHMDEIGLMIKKIDDRGRIYCSPVGSIEPATLMGERVHINSKRGKIHGIISIKEINDNLPMPQELKISNLFVDTGLTKNQLIKNGVELGEYVYIERVPGELGNGNLIYGKAVDDRAGCYILIEVAKKLSKVKNGCEIYYVFTVQEEIGAHGATVASYNIAPDWAVAVDVTDTDDLSLIPTKQLGLGPAITIKDYGTIANRCINDWLKRIAQKKKINLQLDVTDMGVTDALNISLAKGGAPSTVIGVPVRNFHTTVGICHRRDIEQTIVLLTELLKKPPLVCLV